MQKSLIIVDNFYENPDEVREFALGVEYVEDNRWYKGLRSTKNYQFEGVREAFENLIGEKIMSFPDEGSNNGCFQIVNSNQQQVYHCDVQKWAAIIYLTPNAPIESGTRLHRSRITGKRMMETEQEAADTFKYGNYDSTRFDVVDSVGNMYNRLVIMAAQNIHSAGAYFGNDPQSGRLTHLFFFD
jgi:hypothetical protein